MCNPYSSQKWVKEWNQVAHTAELTPNFSLPDKEIKRLETIDWPDREETWKNLEPIIENLEEIYLTGGEPFLSLKQNDFLNQLIKRGLSKKITLKYNTNLTLLPQKLIDLWPFFKKVFLNVSIDGLGPLDEYIRHPTKWDIVEENLKNLKKISDQQTNIVLGVHVTVQMYNILKLNEIWDYFENDHKIEPYLNILNHPKNLNIRTLPEELKVVVENKLKKYKTNKNLMGVVSYMNREDWSGEYFQQFVSYTKKLDSLRKQNFLDIEPELTRYW